MRPEEYLAIVLRRWWIVLLAAVVAAGAAFVYSSQQPPLYQVSVRLMAIAEPPDYWLDLYAKNRLASYQDLIRNADFVADALQRAGLDDDPSRVLGSLELGRNQDSNIVQLVVVDTDPQRAARVANALADAFVAQAAAENQRILRQFRDPFGQRIQGTVTVVKLDSPSPPTTPVSPRTRLNTAAGAVLGFAVGLLTTFVIEYFEDVLRSTHDISRALRIPIIGEIPYPRRRRSRTSTEGDTMRLVVVEEPLSAAAEAYRTLRAQLAQQSTSDHPVRLLLVCGIGRNAIDSAHVAANLAAAFAVAGERVILVEANLRQPLLHELASNAHSPGFVDWLDGSPTDSSPLLATTVPGLQLVPPGTLPAGTNPADLFGRAATRERLRHLAGLADRTIVHAAPLPAFGDALSLASLTDGVLLVIRSGVTPRSAAQQAKAQLERVGAPLLGITLLTQ
ncbi:capsular exopolysaccharide family protein [Thermomicrobium sp. 4228-Ro]|uniref:polysaccharide biosynthesis tyrosine autokinase n=1 Tax=Thermomicrobium sp. 4228-Ro TaxID=2993937 RepID=UPI0022499052|nr:polysaccharide biosynthesis tyrosine autokinase [Thermomicrobium sp. 4228-Ro]MCX2727841.1 capsular exopolysaccharide family protein [Thermomicrobium sp. 4228-Ro]